MGYIAPKLKQRVQIQMPVQTPNDRGGFDLTYETIKTIWARISDTSNTAAKYTMMVGFQNQSDGNMVTHEFMMRMSAVSDLGRQTGKGFDTSFDGIADLNPLKSEYFLFLQRGSTSKGRRFRVVSIQRDETFQEMVKIGAKEIEESGTGAQEAFYG
jgi:head-tail adaptor